MDAPPVEPVAIAEQLERVLSSAGFRRAERSTALLRYLIAQTIDGHADRLKEYTLGAEALGRGESFDPRIDPIVRAEASRLRVRLDQYYDKEGRGDPLLFTLPKGGYVLQFSRRSLPDEAVATHVDPPPVRVVRAAAWVAVVAAVAAGTLAISLATRSRAVRTGASSAVQFEVELTSEGTLGAVVGTDVLLSADGTRVVFAAHDAAGLSYLSTRRLDQARVTRLPGTEGARGPFVSADGRWVGFWADGKLKKTSVDGGAPVVLCDATDLLGASWGEDGTIVAALNPTRKLWRVPAAGGTPQAILDLSAESASPVWPQILPGGELVLYTVNTGAGVDRAAIEVASTRTGVRTVVLRGGTYGRYLSNGYLTYVNQGTLYAVRFDLTRRAVEGAAVPVAENVSYSRTFGYAQVDISQTGTLVYRKGAESGPSVAAWLDRSGAATPLLARPGRYNWLRLSPDGRRLALVATESGTTSIWIHDTQGGETKHLSTPAGDYGGLLWWPTTNLLVFGGLNGMAWLDADRPGQSGSLTTTRAIQVPWSVSPDGRRLAYYEMHPDTGFDLWTVDVAAAGDGLRSGAPEPFLRTPAFEVYPSFSPDGRWLAYASNESGTYEVYVRRFPDDGTKVRVSSGSGSIPRWLKNGRELVYRATDQRIMVVTYRTDGTSFRVEPPRSWAPQVLADTGVLPNFDPGPDDQRLAALLPATQSGDRQSPNHVTFVINFVEQLRATLR